MKAEFIKERETKNTVRYAEQNDPPILGTVYIQKWFLKQLGGGEYPKKLTLEITGAE